MISDIVCVIPVHKVWGIQENHQHTSKSLWVRGMQTAAT